MKTLTAAEIEAAAAEGRKALAGTDKKVALVYLDGFVPNSYKWPAPGRRVRVTATTATAEQYDRKRSKGQGSRVTIWNQ